MRRQHFEMGGGEIGPNLLAKIFVVIVSSQVINHLKVLYVMNEEEEW